MGHTLDDLLDESGLSELRPGGAEKTASAGAHEEEHVYFLKLAERCERAAAQPGVASARDSALAEKTAAIAVIARTLDEIAAITGDAAEKTASEDPRAVAFVERAIARGHSPEAIAVFMKQAGIVSRTAHGLLGRAHSGVGGALARAGGRLADRGTHHLGAALKDVAENLSPANAGRYIEQLRSRYGDARVRQLIEGSGAKLDHVPSVRDLLAAKAESSASSAGSVAERLKGAAVPAATGAAGVVAGAALSDGNHKKKSADAGGASPKA